MSSLSYHLNRLWHTISTHLPINHHRHDGYIHINDNDTEQEYNPSQSHHQSRDHDHTLKSLPSDLWLQILSYMTVHDIAQIGQVNHSFHTLTQSNTLWYKLYIAYTHDDIRTSRHDYTIDWKSKIPANHYILTCSKITVITSQDSR